MMNLLKKIGSRYIVGMCLLMGVVPVLATAQQRLPAPVVLRAEVEWSGRAISVEFLAIQCPDPFFQCHQHYTMDVAFDSAFTRMVPYLHNYRTPFEGRCARVRSGNPFVVRYIIDNTSVTNLMYFVVNRLLPGTYYVRIAGVSGDTVGQYSAVQRVDVDTATIALQCQRISPTTAVVRWNRPAGTTQYVFFLGASNAYPLVCRGSDDWLRYGERRAVVAVAATEQSRSTEQVDTLTNLVPGLWYAVALQTQPHLVANLPGGSGAVPPSVSSGGGSMVVASPRRGYLSVPPMSTMVGSLLQHVEETSIAEVVKLPRDTNLAYYRILPEAMYRQIVNPWIAPLLGRRSQLEYSVALDSLIAAMSARGIVLDTLWFSPANHKCTRGCGLWDFLATSIQFPNLAIKTRSKDARMEEFGFGVYSEFARSPTMEFSWEMDGSLEFRRYVFKPLRTSVVSSAESDAAVQGGTVVGRVQRVSAGSATIELPTPQSGLVSVEVYSVLGSLMLRQEVYASAPITTLTIPLAGYARGYYGGVVRYNGTVRRFSWLVQE